MLLANARVLARLGLFVELDQSVFKQFSTWMNDPSILFSPVPDPETASLESHGWRCVRIPDSLRDPGR
jgi:hypothetical protein